MAQTPGYDANNTLDVPPSLAAAQPRGHRHLRAGLDVQARDDHGRALRAARHAADSVHAAVLDPGRRPRASTTRSSRRHGDDDRRADPRVLLERRRGHDRREARRASGSCTGSSGSASASRPASTSPARARASSCRSTSGAGTTIGNVPIGQGISVTPIQMASVYAAVANGGVWIQPHLVERVGGRAPEQLEAPADRLAARRPRGEGDAHRRRRRARRDRQRRPQIPGYTVAGKTGTAQVPGPHGYSTGEYVASFVGMVPVSTRASSCSSGRRPARSIFGGVVAAPAFAQIAKFDLQYLEVPPDAPITTHSRLDSAPMDLTRFSAALEADVDSGSPARRRRDRRPRLRHARGRARGALLLRPRARTPTGTTSRRRRSPRGRGGARRRAAARRRRCRSSSCRRPRGDAGRGRRSSSATRRASSRSPPSPARTGRRRPRSCSARSSRPPAGARRC